MKKLILAVAITLFGLSNAQINRGAVYISGQVNYSKNEDKNTNDSKKEFKILPSVGVFVAPNLAVGASWGFSHTKRISNQTFNGGSYTMNVEFITKEPSFVIAPFVRKYWTLSDKLYFFGQLEVPVRVGKTETEIKAQTTDFMSGSVYEDTQSAEYKFASVGVNIKPGLDYFINKNWSVEATIGELGYDRFKYKDLDKAANNSKFGLNLSSVSFGVKYVINKKDNQQ
ncbi:outer membrane beta-barrel protein [Chryseobacterium sp. MYb264]|uniref:outer membrane beta-barrel protein n=1 Tax=Chryseobacterium sp. MYb264 TaxID=2745153 RepID=UPI002E11A1E2|nr:outer membrane beta-barrel protein [Chryseobacterium sp. MYb264]